MQRFRLLRRFAELFGRAFGRLLSGIFILAVLPGISALAIADDDSVGAPALRVAGFGTIARSWDDRHDLATTRDLTQLPADSYLTGPSWRIDSRLGVQFSYEASSEWETLFQLVARDQVEQTLDSSVEQANLSYRPRADFKARIGRIGYDGFLMADHRNLGYSYPWVRPPREFYHWIPLYSLDGGDASFDWSEGQALWRLRGQLGLSKMTIPVGDADADFGLKDIRALSLQRQEGAWRLKAGLTQMRIGAEALSLAPLHAGLEAIAGAGISGLSDEARKLRDETAFKNAKIRYYTLGAAFDDGQWVAQAEIGLSRTSAAIAPSSRTAYLGLGYRVGLWTPYLVFSASKPEHSKLAPLTDWGLIGQAGFQSTVYNVVNSTRQDQDTLTLGVRWDVHPQVAGKLQWERTRIESSGYGAYFRQEALNSVASHVNLLTLALDFVF